MSPPDLCSIFIEFCVFVFVFCPGRGNKFNGSSTIDVGESKSFGWLTGQKVRLDKIKGLTGRNRKKN